jgi:hypothetical protein
MKMAEGGRGVTSHDWNTRVLILILFFLCCPHNATAFNGCSSALLKPCAAPASDPFRVERGPHDLGFGTEDVALIEPLLVTYNAKGEVEGVKYDRNFAAD